MEQDESETTEQQESPLTVGGGIISAQRVTFVPSSKEAEWVQQATQGDRDAFVQLCESYVGPLYRYFFHQTRSIDAAGTLTTETLHMAQESISGDNWHGVHFGAWLSLIARRVFDRWLLRKLPDTSLSTSTKFEQHSGENTNALDSFPLKAEEDALWRLVKDLSLAQQRLLVLRHRDHLSFAEIAKRLGRSESACRKLHHRALTNLKRKAYLFGLWSETRKE
jgi:RNA polymerase sigma-70 factor (ECF subfamily)